MYTWLLNWSWDKLTRGEREIAPVVSPHVDVEPSRSRNLLQLALWSGRTPQIIQSAHNPQHRRQSNSTCLPAKTGMRPKSVMDIAIHRPVDPDRIRLGEELCFAVCTDEAAKDFFAWFEVYWVASVVYGGRYGALAIRAKGSIEPDSFHCVVQELVICFDAFGFGPFVDFGEVLFALV